MNIMLVNTFYYPNMIGGTEHSIKLLAEGLVRNGNNVAIYTIDSKGNGIEKENINGVCVYRSTGGKFNLKARQENTRNYYIKIKNILVEMNNRSIRAEFNNVIKEFRPDIIHTNNLYGISAIVWEIANKNNIPIVHTIRDYWILNPIENEKNNYNLIEKLRIKIQHKIYGRKSKLVNYVTSPSKFTLNRLIDEKYFMMTKRKVVYNAINLDIKETKKYIATRRKKKNSEINFIFVGALTKNKGIDMLLKAFCKIKDENIKLNIFGRGNLEWLVKEYIQKDKRINYYGQVDSIKLKEEWLHNDVAIVPSIWEEPFGRVVIEANQFGLPVIGSNKGGILEILENIKTGEIYSFDNEEELKNKILKFSNLEVVKDYYDNIEKNIDQYSINIQVSEFLTIYKSSLRNNKND